MCGLQLCFVCGLQLRFVCGLQLLFFWARFAFFFFCRALDFGSRVGFGAPSRRILNPVASTTRTGEPGAETISPRSRDCVDGTEHLPFSPTPSERAGLRAGLRDVQARGTSSGAVAKRDDVRRKVPFSFFSLGLCKCLWEGACGFEVKLYKCCRVSRSSG